MSAFLSRINPIPAFPSYTGPYKVGTVDVEIPVADLQSPASTPENVAHIKTIQFRVYYPAAEGASGKKIPWLPNPQRAHLVGYTQFLGIGPLMAEILSFLPRHLHYATIPVLKNATLHEPVASLSFSVPDSDSSESSLAEHSSTRWPTMFFSHGLGGSRNAYSHVAGSVASHGVVVFCPEHRDGSSVVSFIRDPDATPSLFSHRSSSRMCLPYRRIPHDEVPEVWDQRDNQLRIRCWELGLLHSAVKALDNGQSVRNLNSSTPTANLSQLHGVLDIHRPGSIIFGGHSFGCATTVQFIKSVFYHDHPMVKVMRQPLYQPHSDSDIVRQITPSTLTILLDMWCFPLVSPSTRELFSLPLPAYIPTPTCAAPPGGNAILAVESETFFKWNEHLHTTARVLSPPLPASSNKTITPDIFETKDGIRLPEPNFFYVENSAHLNQSDFGVLFPWLTNKVFGAESPERALRLNLRAILQLMRTNGVSVSSTWVGDLVEGGEGFEGAKNPDLISATKSHDDIRRKKVERQDVDNDLVILKKTGDNDVDHWHWIDVIGLGAASNAGIENISTMETDLTARGDGEQKMEGEIEPHLASSPPTNVIDFSI